MKRFLLLFVLALAVSAFAGQGTTVRGWLYRQDSRGNKYPAPGVQVRLTHPAYGPSAPASSGGDGMYYLYNVPPGDFVLEVNVSPIIRASIRVYPWSPDQQTTDVPPIRVP